MSSVCAVRAVLRLGQFTRRPEGCRRLSPRTNGHAFARSALPGAPGAPPGGRECPAQAVARDLHAPGGVALGNALRCEVGGEQAGGEALLACGCGRAVERSAVVLTHLESAHGGVAPPHRCARRVEL